MVPSGSASTLTLCQKVVGVVRVPTAAVLVRAGSRCDCWRLARREARTIVPGLELDAWGADPADPTRLLSYEEACVRWACACGLKLRDGPWRAAG